MKERWHKFSHQEAKIIKTPGKHLRDFAPWRQSSNL